MVPQQEQMVPELHEEVPQLPLQLAQDLRVVDPRERHTQSVDPSSAAALLRLRVEE